MKIQNLSFLSIFIGLLGTAVPIIGMAGQTTETNKVAIKEHIETAGLHKVITDKQQGHFAIVSTNREVVILKSQSGGEIWSTNIVYALKSRNVPMLQGRTIRNLEMRDGDLWADLGRGYAIIDPRTGALKGTASR